jgi:hypothetical protein
MCPVVDAHAQWNRLAGQLHGFIVGDLILAAVEPHTPVSVSSVQKQAKEPKIY